MPEDTADQHSPESTPSAEFGLGLVAAGLLGALSAGIGPVGDVASIATLGCLGLGVTLGVRRWGLWDSALTAATAALAATCGSLVVDPSLEGLVVGLITGLLCAALIACVALGALLRRRRREFLDHGWDLALARAETEEVRMAHAVAEERAAMASEVHDGLGHRLTLIAVRAGRLSLDPSLEDPVRRELQELRIEAADAAAAIGETVHLLTGPRPEDRVHTLDDVLSGARGAGLPVEEDLADLAPLGEHCHAAVVRVVREALTNAARHGVVDADHPVTVSVDAKGAEARIAVRNRLPATGARSTTGTGLHGLRHRLRLLGGTLTTSREGSAFVLSARVPLDTHPSPLDAPDPGVTASREEARMRWSRARRAVWVAPVVLGLTALLVAGGWFVLATTAGVLDEGELASIEVGDSRASAEETLPQIQMLDPPRHTLTEPRGAECRYYEASVSFFVRDDVHRICFADDVVTSIDTIPAP